MNKRTFRFGLLLIALAGACDEDTSAPAPSDAASEQGAKADGTKPMGDGAVPKGDGTVPKGDGAKPVDVGAGADSWYLPDGFNPGNKGSCFGVVMACGDGQDNDGDKLIDAVDPECTGPCDNDEGSFELNIPGVNKDCKQDCYWDKDSGNGNDKCDWSHKCDPKSPSATLKPPCSYNPKTKCPNPAPPTCLKVCLPLTPNGCDCFGCCEIYTPTGKYTDTVFLGSGTKCTAKAPHARSGRVIQRSLRRFGLLGSRCSSGAPWARAPTSSLAPRRVRRARSARPAMVPAAP